MDQAAKARELRAQGLTLQEIAGRLGYKSVKSAWKLLNPERYREIEAKQNRKRHKVKLAWQRDKDRSRDGRVPCSECGGPMGIGSARHSSTRCRNCIQNEHQRKCKRLETLWLAGLTFPEIQRELGWSKGYVGRMIDSARAEGYNLPYRYKTGKRAGRKFKQAA